MTGFNFRYYLDNAQSKVEADLYKNTIVILFIRHGQFKIKYRTAVKVKPNQWDVVKQQVKRNKTGYASDNDYLLTIKKFAQDIFYEKSKLGIPLTHSVVKEALDEKLGMRKPEQPLEIFEFIEMYIEESKYSKALKTIQGYQTTLKYLKAYARKTNSILTFDSISLDFYKKFTLYLQKDMGNAVNTAGKYIKNLKALLRESFDRNYHSNPVFQNKKFKVLEEESDTIVLSEEEIQKIYNCDLSDDLRLERVRDIFVVGCWTGLRFSDLSRLTKDNVKDNNIIIGQQKTKEFSPESLVIPILEVVPEIFKKYLDQEGEILPRVPSDQKMNAYLKEIGKKAGITELVPNRPKKQSKDDRTIVPKYLKLIVHTARKSYATNLFLRGNEPIDIMKITGHKTEKEFMKYIKMTKHTAADRIRKKFNGDKEQESQPNIDGNSEKNIPMAEE